MYNLNAERHQNYWAIHLLIVEEPCVILNLIASEGLRVMMSRGYFQHFYRCLEGNFSKFNCV